MGKRTSQLTQLTAAQVAQGDFLPIVDVSAGQTKYVTVKDLTGAPDFGWSATGESWAYSSFNSTLGTGVITVPTDATTKYSIGMWVRFSQTTGGIKYGRIIAVTSTSLTVQFPSGTTLANEALTSPVYSPHDSPFGAPADSAFIYSAANAGNAGGTNYWCNLKGIKHCWNTGGSAPISGSGFASTLRSVTFPSGFFSSLRSTQVSITSVGATQYQWAIFNSVSTTAGDVYVNQANGTNGANAFSLNIIGV